MRGLGAFLRDRRISTLRFCQLESVDSYQWYMIADNIDFNLIRGLPADGNKESQDRHRERPHGTLCSGQKESNCKID